MKVEYGPPPQGGVQHLQYLSDFDGIGFVGTGGAGGMVRLGGAGAIAYGWVKKDKTVMRAGIAAIIVSLLI